MNFINKNYSNLHDVALKYFDQYISAKPFPHIVLDGFFDENLLQDILDEFPNNLDKVGVNSESDPQKLKFTLNDPTKFGKKTKAF